MTLLELSHFGLVAEYLALVGKISSPQMKIWKYSEMR